ncbi:PspC domain-containing protein [Candidatus Woesearchaeota archaeon]|nr:PspC domain-containing protein [Candidatus Woesearchaeota archaeon]
MKQPKRLYRSTENRVIAGVCGGIAEYFNIDPVLVRLIAILLLLANGAGLIAYLIAWIIVPERPARAGR